MFVQISRVMPSLEEGWNNILCNHRIEDIKDLYKILQVIVTYLHIWKQQSLLIFCRTYFLIPFSAILPFLFILLLNIRIIWDLKHVKVSTSLKKTSIHKHIGKAILMCYNLVSAVKAQRFGSNKKLKKEINLFMVLLRCLKNTYIYKIF